MAQAAAEVRNAFVDAVDAVDAVRQERVRHALTGEQRARVRLVADRANAAEADGTSSNAPWFSGLPLDDVEDGAPMTPAEYLDRVDRIVAWGNVPDASRFAARFQRTVQPPLTPEQIEWVAVYLEAGAWADEMLGPKRPSDAVFGVLGDRVKAGGQARDTARLG